MKKAVFAEEVKAGDVVDYGYRGKRQQVTVNRIERGVGEDEGFIIFFVKEEIEFLMAEPGDLFILLDRPLPEGKTIGDALQTVQNLAGSVFSVCESLRTKETNTGPLPEEVALGSSHLQELLSDLLAALEAYELSKPFGSAQGGPLKSE